MLIMDHLYLCQWRACYLALLAHVEVEHNPRRDCEHPKEDTEKRRVRPPEGLKNTKV